MIKTIQLLNSFNSTGTNLPLSPTQAMNQDNNQSYHISVLIGLGQLVQMLIWSITTRRS